MIGQVLRVQQVAEFVDSVEFDNVSFCTKELPVRKAATGFN
jgi:hypothetical protein